MIRNLLAVAFATAALSAMTAPAWGQGAVNVSQSGWQWANPQPQGNTLTEIDFANGRGYASGDFGTLLTTQNGIDWTGIPTGLTASLDELDAVDADTVVAGKGCLMRRSDDGGQTFVRVPFTARERGCPSELAAFHYPTPAAGYVVLRDGSVSRSDADNAFGARAAIPGTPAGGGGTGEPSDAYFVSESRGFVTSGGNIYRTTDSGQTWDAEHAGTTPLAGIYFADPATGYAVGDDDTILKSIDGGSSWSPVSVPESERGGDLTQVRCANPGVCLFATEQGDKVLRTRDGGTTVQALDPSARPVYGFAFATATNAVGVGDLGAIVFSGDAGTLTGTPGFTGVGDRLGGGDPVTLLRLRATDDQTVHAPGLDGRLGRSTNGGRSWSILRVPTTRNLVDSSFVDATTGYAVDSASALRITRNGGGTWTSVDTGGVPSIRAVNAVDLNTVLLFTSRGIRRSTRAAVAPAGATSFAAIGSAKLRGTSFRDFDRAGSALVAWGASSLWRSTDNGAKWRALRKPTKKGKLRSVDFTSARQGFALLRNGRLYVTRNGGRRWSELRGLGTNAGTDVTFPDSRNGWVTIPSWGDGAAAGWLLRTSDGGRTWRPQLIGRAPIVPGALEAPSAANAFALGRDDNRGADLFRTDTGGDLGAASTISVKRSRKALRRRGGKVKLTVSLSPAVSSARVALFARTAGGRWTVVRDRLTTAGRLTVTRRVRRTTQFVAQWYGDADHQGDGSPVGTVTVRRR